MTRPIAFQEEARGAVQKGVSRLARAARVTFGPCGRNVILERSAGLPVVTRDGVTVVREIELDDVFENIGAQMVQEVAMRTGDRAGDGTTTATILAEAIFTRGLKAVVGGVNPIRMQNGIRRAVADVIDSLVAMALPVDRRQMIVQVATIASNQDHEVGELLADVIERVGPDGIVTVNEGAGAATDVEWISGMQFDGGWLSPYFATDPASMQCVLDEPYLLITDQKLSKLEELVPLLEACIDASKPLVVIADQVEPAPLSLLVINRSRGKLECAAVRPPGFGEERTALLEDLAVSTGGIVVSRERGLSPGSVSHAELGRAERVVVEQERTTILGGVSDEPALQSRIAGIRRAIEAGADGDELRRLQERLARLTGGAARIRVGAPTESELVQKKDRVEDALHATRAAVEEGILPGGGVALLRAATSLRPRRLTMDERVGYEIVTGACRAPLSAVAANAGASGTAVCGRVVEEEGAFGYNAATGGFEDLIQAGIIDPMKVTRTALESAASVASLLLTSDVLIGRDGGTSTSPS